MISILARLLGGSTLGAWLVVGALGIGALGGAYWYVSNQGYQRAALEWSAKYDARELDLERQRMAELDRQARANDAAKAAERQRLATLRNEMAQLELQLQERANEAAKDPDRGNIACNIDCVRRHNSLATR
jgi:uncharacterized protein HemX